MNASEHTCDALIVLCDQPPVHAILLPCSPSDAIQLCSGLSELTHDPNAYGKNRASWVRQVLRELWSSVVEPIVAALQDDIQLPPGSRIRWYPTSNFTILSFHATGPYRKMWKNLLDFYVIRARDCDRSKRELRNASGDQRWVHLACHGAQHANEAVRVEMASSCCCASYRNTARIPHSRSCMRAIQRWGTRRRQTRYSVSREVIGTLWKVDDVAAHQVVTQFYSEMFKRPVLDFEYAATARSGVGRGVVGEADRVRAYRNLISLAIHVGFFISPVVVHINSFRHGFYSRITECP